MEPSRRREERLPDQPVTSVFITPEPAMSHSLLRNRNMTGGATGTGGAGANQAHPSEGRWWALITWFVITTMVIIVIGASIYTLLVVPDCGPYQSDMKYEVNCTLEWWNLFKKIAQFQHLTLTTLSVVLASAVAVKDIFPNESARAMTAMAAAVAAGLLATFTPGQTYQKLVEAETLVRLAVLDYEHSPDNKVKGNDMRLWSARIRGETIIHEGSRYIRVPQSDEQSTQSPPVVTPLINRLYQRRQCRNEWR